ncbi:hypothetical protein SAMN02910371_01492 [Butyrivibrio sp. INlla14]|nr:hypothetical protein SAMN02910371_01492 [Butyrivibrio sp. INlla14]
MLFFLICFVPVAFALWIYWQAMAICVRYISFYIKCAMIKKKNPKLYRHLRNKEFRMTNGCGCSYWWLIHHHK